MKTNINDFVVVKKHDNGEVNVSYDARCRANIYKFLREIGFCQTKLGNKRIFYRRTSDGILPVDFEKIEDAFFDRLKEKDFSTIPGVKYSDIFDLFLIENPIRQYKSFYDELKDEMTDEEIHEYLLKADLEYRTKYELDETLLLLQKLKFNRTIDTMGEFTRLAPLYYKQIRADEFLVFNHYNIKEKALYQGFDCWLVRCEPGISEDINQRRVLYKKQLKANFKINNDYHLISAYFDN